MDSGTPLRSVEILLVDDDRPWARATSRLLVDDHPAFSVETAHSLAAARRRFAELDPDCVVCDYQLGDGDGLALLETVREVDPDRPFLLVTGRGSESVASDAIGRGVTDYIRKDHDDDAADLLASRVENAVRTYRTERALARERRSKESMLEVLTATASRADLLDEFCRQLAEQRGFACAWIGTSERDGTVVPAASAGDDDHVAPLPTAGESADGASGRHPAVRALERDEPVVVGPVDATERRDTGAGEWRDVDADEWREAGASDGPDADDAAGDGWRSVVRGTTVRHVAAVPIGHDGVRYGVLVVGASEPGVGDTERRVLTEYADTIGYAIRTAEWKRSLLADRPVSVDVEVRDDRAPLVALARGLDEAVRIEVPSAVDRGDGTTLYLAFVEGSDAASIERAASSVDGLEPVATDEGDRLRCELLAAQPTPESVLTERGARFDETVVERNTATVTALVPDDGAVSAVATAVEDAYDRTEVSTIWTDRSSERARTAEDDGLLAALTDRQREVLRHAFFDGYYESPRGVSATELAERFDIARATLTQHLRTAERKVFDEVLTE